MEASEFTFEFLFCAAKFRLNLGILEKEGAALATKTEGLRKVGFESELNKGLTTDFVSIVNGWD